MEDRLQVKTRERKKEQEDGRMFWIILDVLEEQEAVDGENCYELFMRQEEGGVAEGAQQATLSDSETRHAPRTPTRLPARDTGEEPEAKLKSLEVRRRKTFRFDSSFCPGHEPEKL
ncbi:hypothetical protein KOW79_001964 [Hemibagrus wyckioides]|uniref:Uncharacterized protein n=1 Tax=Hemibagrus wyckioides TaxID=337641 RepID=A0A9D3P9J8_9TELE|nr:hypothetical protein KOW79_001964 [Hemibagrus wyckioides]